ncbi:hypothetical protein ABC766_12935 [Methylobacterium fujisawaense]|uniref:hypothetical protein n=1 Tax=Methylobacterium fujisawaense TaxID=107400 RepID=UPI0031F4DE1B
MPRRRKTFGTSFSWKRASGMSAAKGRLSRQIGVPLTRGGRRQKMGRAMGCALPFALICVAAVGMAGTTIVWALG